MKVYLRGKTYWCEFEIDKKRYRFSTKSKDKRQAQEIASTIHADMLRKRFNMPLKAYEIIAFKDLWEGYIKSQTNTSRNIYNKKAAFRYFGHVFADKNLKNITPLDIQNYQAKRRPEVIEKPKNAGKRESEISFRWVNIEIATLRHFFNWCIKRGIIDKNPCAGIPKLNELSRLKTLSDEDINKLIAGATNKLTRDIISFLIYTGCRKGEALNLKWDDVDLKNGVIAIKATKTRYDRHIPISAPLEAVLNGIEKYQISLPASSEKHDFSAGKDGLYVFNKNGAKIGDFKRSFHTACKNAGLKDLHIHDLRHVFASALTMNDVSLYKTGILLGHRTPNMTQRYAHLKPSELKKEIEKAFGKEDHKDLKREEYERALKIIRDYENENNGGK